jgi:hypothetical protein
LPFKGLQGCWVSGTVFQGKCGEVDGRALPPPLAASRGLPAPLGNPLIAFTGRRDRMTFPRAPTPRTKRTVKAEHEVTTASNQGRRPVDAEGQAPIAVIGLLAIGVIVAVNYLARPAAGAIDGRLLNAPGCKQCGTIVAVRRSAHSVPVTFVEVQMPDGSVRTVRGSGPGYSVGDVVEVRGDALTLRDVF